METNDECIDMQLITHNQRAGIPNIKDPAQRPTILIPKMMMSVHQTQRRVIYEGLSLQIEIQRKG